MRRGGGAAGEPQGHDAARPARGRGDPASRDADRLPRPPAPRRGRHAPPEATSPPRTPSATARPRPSAGSRSWAWPSTSTASRRRSTSGAPLVAALGARRPRRLLRVRARADRPAARHRGRLRARPRGPDGEPARRRATGTTWSARSTSCATRRWTCTAATGTMWTSGAAGPGEGLGALLRDARRGGPHGHVRHPRPPRPREGLGRARAAARRRPAPLLRARDGRHRRVRRGDRGVHGGAAQAGRRDLPGGAASSRCAWRRAGRWRCRATPTCPSSSGHEYERAVDWLRDLGVTELAVFERPRAGGWSRSDERAPGHRLRLAPLRGGPAAGARRRGGARGRARPGGPLGRRRARPRGDRRAAGRRRARRHRPALSPTPTSAGGTPTASPCCSEVCGFLDEHGWTVRHLDATVLCEAPKLGPHRDAMRARLADARRPGRRSR